MSGHSGGRGRGRRSGGHEEEHVNHERWLISYSDMITVLMALFIVLFAISQVDQEKYIALRESLSAGFQDQTGTDSVLDGSDGALTGETVSVDAPKADTTGIVDADANLGSQAENPTTNPPKQGVDPDVLAAAKKEAAHLEKLRDTIAAQLSKRHLQDAVRFRIDERGLVLGLVADDVFFAPASAELTTVARRVLNTAAPALRHIDEQISVEGHANTLPVSGRYATNWELSSDRATQVLRHLVEKDRVPGKQIMAVGYGDKRPFMAGRSAAALEANRRVDLVVLSDAPESVRALLPAVSKE
ncbi:OmpA/MotB family protein [Cellulomonas edaphi]|uniref:Flagellar motor protein MotB n=1 Tax=Cellulomonas edaphi TaxID=3053468 RepID=A0ABT7S6G3_9CELL|nr:flagellar motor protein MotB [Cellulomons edaphi]MDM7830554.1 flagellar motor protein MotB [Cellulomons edaphi]